MPSGIPQFWVQFYWLVLASAALQHDSEIKHYKTFHHDNNHFFEINIHVDSSCMQTHVPYKYNNKLMDNLGLVTDK